MFTYMGVHGGRFRYVGSAMGLLGVRWKFQGW